MTPDENKARVREMFAATDAAQNMNAFKGAVTSDYQVHFTSMPAMDADTMIGLGNAFYSAFSPLSHTLHDVIAEGDMVATRLTISGPHTAPFHTPQGEIPPTGKPMSIEALNYFHMRDGKCSEHWIQFDMMGFMQQITPQG